MSDRMIVLITVLLLLLPPRVAYADAPLERDLSMRLEAIAAAFPGSAGLVISDPRSGARSSVGERRIYPAASLYKLGVMVEAYRRAARGEVPLDDTTITIGSDDATDGQYFTPEGTTLTVREAIERMITISDNSPARALVRFLDAHKVNATLASLGLADTRLNTPLPAEEQAAPFNTTSARDMATLLAALVRGEIVGPKESREMLAVLGRQRINDRLPAGLPEGTPIGHKTGNLPGVSHDVGVITTPLGPRVAVMLTSDFADPDDVTTLAEQLAALAYGASLDTFVARYVLNGPNVVLAKPNGVLTWTVLVTNASTFAWSDTTTLVERWQTVDSGGHSVEIGRLPISTVAVGGVASIKVQLAGPVVPGAYVLELEVVDPSFGSSGNRLSIGIVIAPPATKTAPATPTPTPTPQPPNTPAPLNTPPASPVPTPVPTATATPPTVTPIPADSPTPTAVPQPTATPQPTDTPAPTATPRPPTTPQPTDTPEPTATPRPPTTPQPADTPQPSDMQTSAP